MLIQLRNGDWVESKSISSIRAYPEEKLLVIGSIRSPRVVVIYGMRDQTEVVVINFPSYEEAAKYRDELAKKVEEVKDV